MSKAYVYVASSFQNARLARHVMDLLEARKVVVTYDWTANGAVKGQPDHVQQGVAEDEVQS